EPRLFSQGDARAHAYADDDQIGVERAAGLERDVVGANGGDAVLEMKFDAVLFVQRADEVAELRPEHAFERTLFRRDHMHLDVAGAQGGSRLEADKARANDDGPFDRAELRDDGAAVGE